MKLKNNIIWRGLKDNLSIFKIINNISIYVADKLILTDIDDNKWEHYKLAMTAILSFIVYCVIAIVLSLIFGYWPYIILSIFLFGRLRENCGGAHANYPYQCLISTTLCFFLIGISVVLVYDFYIIVFLLSILNFIGLNNIPRYDKAAIQHMETKQILFKKKYICIISMFTLINILLIVLINVGITSLLFLDLIKISICFSSSMIVVRLLLTDLSFWIFEKLS